MNDALLKFLYFVRSNFWDWQFLVFVCGAVLLSAFHLLNGYKIFDGKFFLLLKETAKKDAANYLLILAANVLLGISVISITGIPAPQTHDEFGYLLAADTFLQGRTANPTPVSPAHFEYFHILLKPVYAAKYPPLQGVFLAVGTLITGYSIAGVWLSAILASFAVYWFLRCFFSPSWALYGGFLWIFAPLNIGWCDSYWGGHPAVIGGALSLGAFFRFRKDGSLKYLFVWWLGIFLLLNSRLYEGTILTGFLVFLWIFETLKEKRSGKDFFAPATVLVLIIAANLSFIGVYNYSVTGDPWRLPYSLHHAQYHRTPLFIFQNLSAPKPDIPPVIRKLDDRWAGEFQDDYKDWSSTTAKVFSRVPIYLFWLARSPFLIIIFLGGLILPVRNRAPADWKKLPVIAGFFLGGLFLTTWTGDRFVAPIVGIFFAVATLFAQTIYQKGRFFKLLLLMLPFIIGFGFLSGMLSVELKKAQLQTVPDNFESRTKIENFLRSQPGKHLLFVETDDALPADARFYVYNRAEIGESEIIWAHNLSPAENSFLINRYPDRRVWLLKNLNNRAILVKYEDRGEQQIFVK
jgi:hypothetical protein